MKNLRHPAIPLVSVDPFLNIWSCCDNLTDDTTRHWTGRRHSLIGLIKIDGRTYRFMGKLSADNRSNRENKALTQTNVEVRPMSTIYTFENEIVRIKLSFVSPLLMSDLKLMSRPVSYINYQIECLDGKQHDVKLIFGADCEIATDNPMQEVCAHKYKNGIKVGRGETDVLKYSGDDHNIFWGWLHMFSPDGFVPELKTRTTLSMEADIRDYPSYGTDVKIGKPFSLLDNLVYITLSKEFELKTEEKGYVCLAYDDIHSINYMGKIVDAYYKKDGDTFYDVYQKAMTEYDEIMSKVDKAEEDIINKASALSEKYCDIVSLVYRQVIAAHKLTYDGEELQFFSKECFSNGCIATLDVTYPSIPMFLKYCPELVEGMMNPIFKFAVSDRWEFNFAPHDLGQFPLATGQVYGFEPFRIEPPVYFQMPVEESGNAILCVYSLCHYKNDFTYFVKHRDCLELWVKYLIEYGLDPQDQRCTDDFAGRLAHNCNLSMKAIMGIYAYGKCLEAIGDNGCEEYLKIAREYAKECEEKSKIGNHSKLAFDANETWSIKYNAVWDRLFKWNLFSDEFYKNEVNFYKGKVNEYGLPLDCRADYTKSDWQMWSVGLYNDKEYFNMIVDAMWKFLDETYDRVPFTDWYFTSDPKQKGFQNRTVQGGLYFPMLFEQ